MVPHTGAELRFLVGSKSKASVTSHRWLWMEINSLTPRQNPGKGAFRVGLEKMARVYPQKETIRKK